VAVNKLDAADPAWSKERFDYIQSMVLDFLKQNGFKEKKITFVPVSGLTGVNVSREGGKMEDEEGRKALKKWYNGPTLVEALDGFVPAKREFEKPLRVIVTDVSSEGKNVTVRGRVVQGFVRMGDSIVVLPVGDEANVVRVERGKATKEGASPYSYATTSANEEKDKEDIPGLQDCALAGEIVEVTLSGIDPARLSPGCVICHPHPSLRPKVKRKFEARVLVMERLAVPIIRGSQVLLHMHSIDVPAVLNKLVSSEKRGEKPRQNPRVLTGGVTATVEITLSERLVIEESNECKSLGRFVLRRGGDTIAVGLIDKVLDS
jgi:elongation factor 1 alpha-like protein